MVPKLRTSCNLAKDINTSRATVMNYIKNLADARLINIVYPVGQQYPKKPAKVMLQNSNLIYAIYPIQLNQQQLMETFLSMLYGKTARSARVTRMAITS